MKSSKAERFWHYDVSQNEEGGMILFLQGRMDSTTAAAILRDLDPLVRKQAPPSLTLDLSKVTYLDDFGALVLARLRDRVSETQGRFSIENASAKIHDLLAVLRFETLRTKPSPYKKPSPGVFVRLGEAALAHASELKYMVSFAGSVFLALIYTGFHPRTLRTGDTLSYMEKTGVDALPIVGLISFLMGLIIAFMSSVQLQQFGANIYVASLVGLAMTRELGPIMTAIIVAGRSGSAFAAEIGTMKVSEEVDALFTMGFDPTRFLVIPKLLATLVVVPLLTLFSDLFAMLGGLLVGVGMLDLTASAYVTQTMTTLEPFDVFWGVLKSAVFALLIAWIGCFRGFRVGGGAAGVGQGTTSAVVSSIFLIVLTDSVFSVILRYWG
jgi:phospholipid/cholesterol/gamma-HCH transport system permease protein